MSEQTILSDLISISQAAQMGYGSVSTLQRRINSGKLPTVKLRGTRIRLQKSDLEALVAPVLATERDRMVALARQIANAAPKLSEESKVRLASLLQSQGATRHV